MPKTRKPAPPKTLTATEKLIQACVRNVKARKSSGQSDRQWRQEYARTLRDDSTRDGTVPPLSATPFSGDAYKKR